MVALRRVRPDRPALSAVAICGSGSGPPAKESPQEESHCVMRGAVKRRSALWGSAGAKISPDGRLASCPLTVEDT